MLPEKPLDCCIHIFIHNKIPHIISSISGVFVLHVICLTKCLLVEYMQTVCDHLLIRLESQEYLLHIRT
jgi:hypothetical protein